MWAWSRATNVSALTDDVLDTMLDHAARIRSRRSAITAWQLGGAVARVGAMETPFGSRSSAYLIDFLGASSSGRAGVRAPSERARTAGRPWPAPRRGVRELADGGR